jgi:hypothetical protein
MKVSIDHIRLRAVTSEGTFGTDLALNKGLNILSADNTTGKSTCVNSVIYALGLERMLSARREVPLSYALQDRLNTDDGRTLRVVKSWVEVQLTNAQQQVITVRRPVSGAKDTRLVSLWSGPALTEPDWSGPQRDYFARDPGAAQRSAGIHKVLADFFGWSLPAVPSYQGGSVPLYMETLFPMFFVEQKAGWSVTQGPFPTFLQVQDVGRRAVEFVLDLDSQRTRLQRSELEQELRDIETRWRRTVGELHNVFSSSSASVAGLSTDIDVSVIEPHFRLTILILQKGQRVELQEALRTEKAQLATMLGEETPLISDAAPTLQTAL